MRVMVIVHATKTSEQGILPKPEDFAAMGAFNEKLVKAGVMLDGDGLKPSSKGKRIRITDTKKTVIDGPFAETKELIAGFWIWQVKSMEEALEWAKQCPNPMPGDEGVLEIRPFYEAEDFGDAFPPDLKKKEDSMRAEIARSKKG
jgi:hypothetical protein